MKLLIVDDDPTTRALLAEALEMHGACVMSSASVLEAQRTLAAWHPDMMISDVGMPRHTGYDLIRNVRGLPAAQGGSTPAIACTACAGARDRVRAIDAGFDAVVSKPVDLDVLVETIGHVAAVREPGSAAPAGDGSGAPGSPRRSAPDS